MAIAYWLSGGQRIKRFPFVVYAGLWMAKGSCVVYQRLTGYILEGSSGRLFRTLILYMVSHWLYGIIYQSARVATTCLKHAISPCLGHRHWLLYPPPILAFWGHAPSSLIHLCSPGRPVYSLPNSETTCGFHQTKLILLLVVLGAKNNFPEPSPMTYNCFDYISITKYDKVVCLRHNWKSSVWLG